MISETKSGLKLQGIKKIYDDFILDISFSIQQGEFVSLVGPSGCGKTTTLSIISGLLDPDEGSIYLNGKDLLAVPIWDRAIGFVFQDYALFPNMNIEQNIGYGLKVKKVDKADTATRTNMLLSTIGLSGYNKRLPDKLSGGEKQRVALARALAPNPELLLLDEPLSALDAQLRKTLRKEISTIQRDLSVTTIYVTHDQEEALSISDRIIMINKGTIEQIGTPEEIYSFPKTRFSAQFFGRSTLLPAEVTNNDSFTCTIIDKNRKTAALQYTKRPDAAAGTIGYLFFRPENTIISTTSETNENSSVNSFFSAEVVDFRSEYNGSGYFIECLWKSFPLLIFSKVKLMKGTKVTVTIPIEDCLFIPEEVQN